MPLLSGVLVLVFAMLSVLHLYWAAGGRWGWKAALPQVAGRKAFKPSAAATVAVAACLAGCAGLVVVLAGWWTLSLDRRLVAAAGYVLVAVFALRAVGDFKWCGFFKGVRGTAFARNDDRFYSPLCLLLAIGLFLVTAHFAKSGAHVGGNTRAFSIRDRHVSFGSVLLGHSTSLKGIRS